MIVSAIGLSVFVGAWVSENHRPDARRNSLLGALGVALIGLGLAIS